MTNPNDTVSPELGHQLFGNEYDGHTGAGHFTFGGLTKREYFAAMAMQGLSVYSYGGTPLSDEKLAVWSVNLADALIAELNKEASNG